MVDKGSDDAEKDEKKADDKPRVIPGTDGKCAYFFDDCEAFEIWRYVIQWTNVAAFILMVGMNIASQFMNEFTLA